MKRLPASVLFTTAAIYLIIQGELDLLVLPVVLACVTCAVISLSKNHLWALLTGIGLISVSLTLQISMNYWCNFCLKTDMLILAAIINLAIIQKGKLRIPAWVMASVISIVMFGVTTIAGQDYINTTSSEVLEISEETTVLAKQKPVLLFNPNCAPCGDVVKELIEIDPAGDNWQAVQSGGLPEEGQKYLEDKGYQGVEIVFRKQPGTVPALIVNQNGETVVLRKKETIINHIADTISAI